MQTVATRPATAAELVALHTKAQARIFDAAKTFGGYYDLHARVHNVATSRLHTAHLERDRLRVDLEAIIAAPDDAVVRMVMAHATAIGGCPVDVDRDAREALVAHNTGLAGNAAQQTASRLKARGIVIRAEGGNLHVSPVHLLTDADRWALAEHKAGLLSLLSTAELTI